MLEKSVSLIIPALNEADCLAPLLAQMPVGLAQQIIVVDNGSTDGTGEVARKAGAQVIVEPRRGYGYACAAGLFAASGDILVFMDGDGSFVLEEIATLLRPLIARQADLVLGSRALGDMTPGAMPAHQIFGNKLVARLLHMRYGLKVTDLGPFRAIRREFLLGLEMQERTYGWPVEMMVKAARQRARIVEVPVTYRPRLAGKSKVGGDVRGTLLAAYRIFRVVFQYAVQ
jgi:glycosyltransferase involved in cell wall biosynthesis